jgi:hypothetical protein
MDAWFFQRPEVMTMEKTSEKVHMVHGSTGGALCGALAPRCTAAVAEAVTCPLCLALLEGHDIVLRAADAVQTSITRKLAELQRDPGVRMLTGFARSVLLADRERRGAGACGTSVPGSNNSRGAGDAIR